MAKTSRGSVILIAAVVLVIGALGLVLRLGLSRVDEDLKPVRISVPANFSSSLVFLAKAKGYFADEGVDVEVTGYSTGREAMRSMLNGEADLAAAYETPVVLAKMRGHSPVVLTEIYSSSGLYGLVYPKAGRIRDPDDLKGRRIGLPMGTSFQFLMEFYLTTHSIPKESVQFINIEVADLSSALREGKVDAVVTMEPKLSELASAVSEFQKVPIDFYTQLCVLLSQPDFIKKDRGRITKVVKALRRAELFYSSDEKEARRLILAELGLSPESYTDTFWEKVSLHTGLSTLLLTMVNLEIDWAARSTEGTVAETPRGKSMFEPAYMNRIAPELVTYQ